MWAGPRPSFSQNWASRLYLPICPECNKRRKMYDRQPQRLFEYIPIWAFKVYFRYAPRRVACPDHGVKVEALPWAYGKERMTYSYQVYLTRWAKRLSWKETADIFETSWDTVFRAVKFVVAYGLDHRNLEGVTEIGVDEISVFKGHKYLTLVYQLNAGTKRLLWSGSERKAKTFLNTIHSEPARTGLCSASTREITAIGLLCSSCPCPILLLFGFGSLPRLSVIRFRFPFDCINSHELIPLQTKYLYKTSRRYLYLNNDYPDQCLRQTDF